MQRSMQPARDITINLLDEEDEDVATQTVGNNQPARHITIYLGSKGAEGDEEMPGGQEKRRRSQNQDEAYCSVASASSLINTTNYYQAGNQVMVTGAVQKGEREMERESSPLQTIVRCGWCISLLYSHY